jgi:hypothetical protein
VKYLSVNDADAKFAAGRDKLIVALPTSGVIQRWDLKTFEKDVTVAIPFAGRLTAICMGSNSDGPLLVCTEGNIPESESGWALMDIAKMKLIKMNRGIYLTQPSPICCYSTSVLNKVGPTCTACWARR